MRDRDEKKGKKKFSYSRRDAASYKKQATRKGGSFDNPFKGEFPVFFPKIGKSYRIRVLPPTWDNPENFAYDVFVHAQIGPDNARYVCLKKHGNGPCPCCEEEQNLARDEEKELAYEIKAKARSAMWIIDRDNEKEGPMIFAPSWVFNRDLNAICVDEETNEVLYIDDPEQGYDISFKCEKQQKFQALIGLKIGRKSTPISDDEKEQEEWLEYITENPIPSTLLLHDYDYIAKVLAGKKAKDKDEDEEESGPRTRAERGRSDEDEDEEEKPRRRSLRDEDEEDYTKPAVGGRRKLTEDDELDEEKPRRRKSEEVEEDEEDEDDVKRPRTRSERRSADGDEDDEKGESDEDERTVSHRRSERDDDQPSESRHRDRDDRNRRTGSGRTSTADDEGEREDRRARREVRRRD